MTNINPTAPSTIAPGELFSTGTGSVQFMFAQLQLMLSQANKDKALEKMDTIKKNQDLAKQTADMIAQARALQDQVKKGGEIEMTPEMKAFFEEHGIQYKHKEGLSGMDKVALDLYEKELAELNKQLAVFEEDENLEDPRYIELKEQKDKLEKSIEALKAKGEANATKFNNDEWEYNLKSLSNFQEQIGTDTQQLMVFVQDFMGQYNAYLTGANSAIREGNQTLATVARGQ